MMKIIAVDIGGTFVKWALIDKNMNILEKGKFNSEALTFKTIKLLDNVIEKCNEIILENNDVVGIGISIPGGINTQTGEIIFATVNLPESQGLNVIEYISKSISKPVKVMNDANAATLGEQFSGELKGRKSGVLITLGSGIGSGIIINGKLHEGNIYFAGEVGRQLISEQRWETTSSTRTLVNNFSLVLGKDNVSGKEIFVEMNKNKDLIYIYEDWILNLAKGISNIILLINPEIIVIGGGISENSLFKISDIIENLKLYLPMEVINTTIFVKASKGNDASLIGVASLFI